MTSVQRVTRGKIMKWMQNDTNVYVGGPIQVGGEIISSYWASPFRDDTELGPKEQEMRLVAYVLLKGIERDEVLDLQGSTLGYVDPRDKPYADVLARCVNECWEQFLALSGPISELGKNTFINTETRIELMQLISNSLVKVREMPYRKQCMSEISKYVLPQKILGSGSFGEVQSVCLRDGKVCKSG